MKKILIIANMFESGGVEVSLLNLIKELRKNDNVYIKLLVLRKKGPYLDSFEDLVDIDEIKFRDNFYNPTYRFEEINGLIKKINKLFIKIINKLNIALVNKILLKKTIELKEDWDMAIDFHGYGFLGTAYMVDKISAKCKITFIHDEKIKWMNKIKPWINNIDYYFVVSKSCYNITKKKYPNLGNKLIIFHNLLNKEDIIKKSKEKIEDTFDADINIVTVGRLEKQKGYDILIKISNLLKEADINFKWYILGRGTQKSKLIRWVKRNNLNKNVCLKDFQKNPYPYIKNCDIYVQPSRHEGYGIAIAEAKILCKPIIASRIGCIEEQIIDKYNGLIVDINEESFYKAIISLTKDKDLQKKIVSNLKKDNMIDYKENDMKKIYDLL